MAIKRRHEVIDVGGHERLKSSEVEFILLGEPKELFTEFPVLHGASDRRKFSCTPIEGF